MRSHYCGHINESLIDQSVNLCGWVHRRRDHGGLIFVDLRDREGLVQIVFDPADAESFATAETLRSEFVVKIQGNVRYRPAGTINEKLASGKVEVLARKVTVLNAAEAPPFRIDDFQEIGEDTRLRYRYLDLRRPEMMARMMMRSRVNKILREFLSGHDFLEVETPFLTKSTPEGARDYLVPSRVNTGAFYALPQSPQIFKQLLMVAGVDRYYQIVRCFRDEDLRADRQPEFTQLDIEMAFIDEKHLQNLMEEMIRKLFMEVLQVALPDPIPKMTYAEAIERFGIDRPDLRIPLELVEISDIVQNTDFRVFADPANAADGRVAALRLPKGHELSRKEIDDYTQFVGIYGAKGLAYIKVNDRAAGLAGLQSPILKFLPHEAVEKILTRTQAESGDIVFFGAGKAKIVNESLGALRAKLGHDRGLVEAGWRPVWVIDFPMFEWDEKDQRWQSLHHPFTAPAVADPQTLLADPGHCISRAYDLVLNGSEIGGGSIRIHSRPLQQAVFETLGIAADDAEAKFGHLLNAFRYGCPPHGGIAFGLDRLVMLMSGANSIREVIAFPKTQTAACPLTDAPSQVSDAQLKELGIKLIKPLA